MPTLEELGQRVKAKYPGAYDHLDDVDVAAKIKAKYPGAYDQFSTPGMEKLGGVPPAAGARPTFPAPREDQFFPEQDIPGAPGMSMAASAGNRIARGVESMSGPEKSHGASQIIRGLGQATAPAMIPAIAAAPAATISGLATGAAAGYGVQHGLEAAGVDPGKAELGGDAAGIIGGGMGTNLPRIAPAIGRAALSVAKNPPVSPDIVGMFSPAAAYGMRTAGKFARALSPEPPDVSRPVLGPGEFEAPKYQSRPISDTPVEPEPLRGSPLSGTEPLPPPNPFASRFPEQPPRGFSQEPTTPEPATPETVSPTAGPKKQQSLLRKHQQQMTAAQAPAETTTPIETSLRGRSLAIAKKLQQEMEK